ncbi:RNA ligase family protein [Nocardia sp. NPDC056611]|uniref:RNA ligase family protein n=1 Tax=Nocardia sp. NPDC056611 TaxID=3345877 RepID=UPI003670E371
MKFDKPINENYSATIVRVPAIVPLKGRDFIVGVPVHGYQAIVQKDNWSVGDLGVFLPAEAQLSEDFAARNNLHKHSDRNDDPTEVGYLEDNRRIKAIKFAGHRSDAMLLPLKSVAYTGIDVSELREGDTFDTIGDHEICRKYEIATKAEKALNEKNKGRTFSRVDRKHFHTHVDTSNYFRVRDQISADTEIIVSAKYHGTSWRGANTIVARELPWRDRIAKRLGVRVQETGYDHVFGSRRVLKDVNNPRQQHFYAKDIWSEFGSKLGQILPEGFIVFGELVGYTSDGAEIQKDYHYGLPQGTHELFVYRVAQINPQGRLTDLSWDQVVEFARDHGLNTVPVLWRGKHSDFDVDQFLDVRFRDLGYETLSLGPDKTLVDEGVVIRVEGLVPFLAKAKSPRFFAHETRVLDEGVADLESTEAVAA